ncbi:MAG: GNAT family N-acetyltransferase [Gemmatimonadales bacterium]
MGWLPEPAPLKGPELALPGDVDALNRVFSDAFTDRYRRDGLSGMRVPYLNPLVWCYAIDDSGAGAMVWRDDRGHLAAFNMVHLSGTEGWMGPLAVRPDRQGRGEGLRVVQEGVDWLRRQGANTIGLETMPRTVENIGFYSSLGFLPGHLTVTLVHDVDRRAKPEAMRLSKAVDRDARLAACTALTRRLSPGVDFSREQVLTERYLLGDTTLLERDGELLGFALWHSAALADVRGAEEVRVLKCVAIDHAALKQLLNAVIYAAGQEGMKRVALRCQTAFGGAYAALVADGWRAHWTDLRMTLAGCGEPQVAGEGVVWSNWEI